MGQTIRQTMPFNAHYAFMQAGQSGRSGKQIWLSPAKAATYSSTIGVCLPVTNSVCYQVVSIMMQGVAAMAVQFFTGSPKALLIEFDKRINQDDPKGKITTWTKDSDGDYTHVAKDWMHQAWFRPRVVEGCLVFNIFGRTDAALSTIVYGYYHGHLTETFLNHFDDMFKSAASSAQLTTEDYAG